MGKKQFCFFQTAETGNRTPVSGVKGSGANHYPRAPAPQVCGMLLSISLRMPLENKSIEHIEVCFICGVYCSIVLLQSTATKKQDI